MSPVYSVDLDIKTVMLPCDSSRSQHGTFVMSPVQNVVLFLPVNPFVFFVTKNSRFSYAVQIARNFWESEQHKSN